MNTNEWPRKGTKGAKSDREFTRMKYLTADESAFANPTARHAANE
jgi:hypothetical protein